MALHNRHVADLDIPCSACHDPHGVPVTEGGNQINGAHLINFDTRYAGPVPLYDSLARTCTVACHSANPRAY